MPNDNTLQPMYLRSGDPETENEASLLYPGMLGARITIKQPAFGGPPGAEANRFKTYQLIQTDSTMSVNPYAGAVAWWADKTKYLVTTSPTALGRGRVAGVFQNPITPGNFGCVQTKGPGTVNFIDAVVVGSVNAAGNFVIPSATAGKADVVAAGTASTYPPLGYTAGSLGPGVMAVVDLDVPETP
jgi:hypothetical protein